jgi:hypothetical protein
VAERQLQLADEEWVECVHRYEENCPAELYEDGTLADWRGACGNCTRGDSKSNSCD